MTSSYNSINNYLKHFDITSSSPASITIGAYGTAIILGMIQGIGGVAILVQIQGGAIKKVINMIDGSDFSNDNILFSFSTNVLTITPTSSSDSRITVIAGGANIRE